MAGTANIRVRRATALSAAVSKRMGGIRQHGTAPELAVRRLLSSLRVRYRTKNRDLPGSPDLANRRRRFAVFVHGCFWHRHEGCARTTMPKNNAPFWRAKFVDNVARDSRASAILRAGGYRVLTIWECETTTPAQLGALRGRLAKLRSRPSN